MQNSLVTNMDIGFSLNTNRIILIAPIEGNRRDINSLKQGYERYYEDEAIKCFKCWRKNAGWLSDIEIYAICPTKHGISDSTKKIFNELKVNYIENYEPETSDYLNGYWNIPLVGKWVEDNFDYDISIKIDLDMYIIKELPKRLFELQNLPLVGRYDEKSSKHKTNKLLFPEIYGPPFDTGLVISRKEDKFYNIFYDVLKKLTLEYQNGLFDDKEKYGFSVGPNGLDYGVIEEFAISILNVERPDYIKSIAKYNLGEFYVGIEEYTDQELESIYFFHEHLPCKEAGYDGNRMRLKYTQRMLKNGVSSKEIRLDSCD